MQRRGIRFGLLLDSLIQPAWVERSLRLALEVADCQLALVVIFAPETRQPDTRRRRDATPHSLYRLYSWLDRRITPGVADPFVPVDLAPLLAGVPTITVVPTRTTHSDVVAPDDVARIRSFDLDVILRYGFRILRGEVLTAAPHGVWSHHHGDNRVNRGSPAGFWEVMRGEPSTGCMLQVLTDELDGGRVLARASVSTDRRSVHRNRARCYWRSAHLVASTLRDIQRDSQAASGAAGGDEVPAPYSGPLLRPPANGAMARCLLRLVGRFVRDKVERLSFREEWYLAYSVRGTSDVPDLAPFRFRTLLPPRGRFWADPFVVVHDDRRFIFFEEWVDAKRRAHISVIEVDAKGAVAPAAPVLEQPYHLSYPFVFRWNHQFWMIPETARNRRIELYRSTRFPYEWELDRVLMSDVVAVDTTLAEIDGRWWMFTSIAEGIGGTTTDELHLFHAQSPLGPWTPHAGSPVKRDAASARPAGRLFRHAGCWYRPSQDCAVSYGYAININRIDRLDETQYTETEVARLLPQWRKDLNGTHTVNAEHGVTVIDARRLQPRWR